MARLWMTGFEANSTTQTHEWNLANTGSPTVQSTTKRTGTYALRINPSSSTAAVNHQFVGAGDSGPYFVRAYLYIASAPTANTIIVAFGNGSAFTHGIRLNTDRTLTLRSPAGTDSGTSSALALSTWYRLELRIENVGTGTPIVAKLDGTDFGTYSPGSTPGAIASAHVGSMTSASCDLYFDDIAVNNSTGSDQASYPGAGSIAHLRPDAAGDNNEWLKSGGGAGTTTNYQDCDEVTPDDATTYLKITATTDNGKIDLYNLDSSTTAGITSGSTVNLVAWRGRGYFVTSIDTWLSMTPRFKLSTNTTDGTKFYGSVLNTWYTFNPGTTTGATAVGQEHLVAYTKPGGGAWSTTDLDSLQAGAVVIATTISNEMRLSQVYAMVDYVPSAVTVIPHKQVSVLQAVKRAGTY